ncbi:hypothetical protein G5B37_06690 [Rasiella rasia]|uniref:Uncharacterized protein n=1 Tax=Rasiella rasia TaxID=2744027 RepID=A0A6G6GL23_9FLAO|nr:hypothetical protein [Rasiella rasia]QIE59259.1 hypothetical protein G5B37_06690 [Rasiella rasia]
MTMNSYEDAMKENEAQIRIRKTRLLRYDFLEHNLNAALEPQTNIKIP